MTTLIAAKKHADNEGELPCQRHMEEGELQMV